VGYTDKGAIMKKMILAVALVGTLIAPSVIRAQAITGQDSLRARVIELERRVLSLEEAIATLVGTASPVPEPTTTASPVPEPTTTASPVPEPTTTTVQGDESEIPIQISLVKKGFSDGRIEDNITLEFLFQSSLAKDVRAFTGVVVFQDLFERDIMRVNLTVEDGLTAGGTATWEGAIDYNQFMDRHQRLRTVDQADLITKFELQAVIFTDGTRRSFGSN
jgi:hypothetical protein